MIAARDGQAGTWITDEMQRAYVTLHELGFAHSVETWVDGRLVGGNLSGASLGDLLRDSGTPSDQFCASNQRPLPAAPLPRR